MESEDGNLKVAATTAGMAKTADELLAGGTGAEIEERFLASLGIKAVMEL